LRHLNLKLSLSRLGPPCKDIKDEYGPINYFTFQLGFKIANLRRRQFIIKNNEIAFIPLKQGGNFLNLPRPM